MNGASSGPKSPGRLAPIDGLRAVAVLGVIWWHSWIATGNPSLWLRLGSRSVNLERALAPLGTGFQLFFVISGFCLYLSYQRLIDLPALQAYGQFLRRRWWRLSPAFYLVCAVTAAVRWIPARQFLGLSLFAHATWLFGWIPGVDSLSPVFWTLEVEWEFYLLLPLLFFGGNRRLHLGRLWILAGLCLVWRGWISRMPDGVAVSGYELLPTHFLAFAWGMLAAEFWVRRQGAGGRLGAAAMVGGGLALVYLGRGLQATEVFAWAAPFGWPLKIISEPVIALGYGCLVLSSVTWSNRLLSWLAHPFFQMTGRLSYGLYLWHWWPSVWLGAWALHLLGHTVGAHYLALGLVLATAYPLAWLTYRYFELPFLRSGTVPPPPGRVLPARL